ncbi:MAG: peptide chain release factor N(5)-glutamine methyltransferase [Dehalococcoidia bacterium]
MTIAEAVRRAEARLRDAGIDDARLEAEVLLCHTLGVSRESLFARLHEPVREPARYDLVIQRRLEHEPSAYIVGHREFYGLELACTPDALVPRPETELLVEHAIEWLGRSRPALVLSDGEGTRDPRLIVVDVGTGNGAIAVALAANARQARVVGIDPSRAALRLARRNAKSYRVGEQVAFVQGELLAPLRGPVDVIVANLPYIPTSLYEKLPPEIRDHEPKGALHAGRRGTALIEALLTQATAHLRPRGLLLAEHAWNQGRRLREAARESFPAARIETKRDLAGRERMLVVETA